jgi:hypothetical protein
MIQTIKRKMLVAATALMLLAPTFGTTALVSAAAPAGCNAISGAVANGAENSLPNNGGSKQIDCTDTSVGNDDVTNLARRIVTTFSIIVGAASVIMIIYGGFRYITSGGESGRVGAAKNALLYAIIGLVIVALAQLIVHFVLNQANQVAT